MLETNRKCKFIELAQDPMFISPLPMISCNLGAHFKDLMVIDGWLLHRKLLGRYSFVS